MIGSKQKGFRTTKYRHRRSVVAVSDIPEGKTQANHETEANSANNTLIASTLKGFGKKISAPA
jgi:hypothetical protein